VRPVKLEYHLTLKNFLSVLVGICVVALAFIPLTVSAEHLLWMRWQAAVVILTIVALVSLFVQAGLQSKEDHEKEEKESKRDKTQEEIVSQLAQLSSKGTEKSLVLTEAAQDIQPVDPPVNFDALAYFKHSYHSLWTADIEKRVKIAAAQNRAHFKPEDFYAQFIGVGMAAYSHDITWAYIWKSQFLMLAELNRRGGIMPISAAKSFYDQGAADYPGHYKNYTFDQWMVFVQTQELLIRHPSEMIDITFRGRDFLSYSAHHGRSADQKSG
jgi:hypothetical protein